jgi:tetratricopeptide (TPR) repeat protein
LCAFLTGGLMPQQTASADVLVQSGLQLQQQGRLRQACEHYQQALELCPWHAPALTFLGLIELQRHDAPAALDHLERAVRSAPENVAAQFVRGQILRRLGRNQEAAESFAQTTVLKPDLADAHFQLGEMLCDLRHFETGLDSLKRAVELEPLRPEFHNHYGQVLSELGKFDGAVASFQRVITLLPNSAPAHFNLGCTLAHCEQFEQALLSLDRAVALEPQSADAWYARGNVLKDLQRTVDALASYERAAALDSSNPLVLVNRGNALAALHRTDEALASYDRALALAPENIEAWCNRGNHLCATGALDAALESLNRAIALEPEYAPAHTNRAFVYLLKGDLAPGWVDYEWRWRAQRTLTWQERRSFPQPRWNGGEPLVNRTIFVHREQGLGDALQFCRYVPLLAAAGVRVIMEIHAPLLDLFRGLSGVTQLIERGQPPPPFDCWSPLLSLPLAFNTDLGTIPASVPYLFAEPERVAVWEGRIARAAARRPRVAVVWSGGAVHPNDHNRSMSLAQLLPHLPAGCEYISLQKDVRQRDRTALELHPWLLDVGADLSDFRDTAAACACVDLVVSIDSSVAHLAGALGKPVWVLLPHSPDWRWLLNRDDSPWYPTARLYRQSRPADWDQPLRRLAADLRQRFDL